MDKIDLKQSADDYDRIAAVLRYLEANREDQPSLDHLAQVIGLSPFHFQRLFKRWVGLSPKQFLDALTIEYAKSLLHNSRSILDTTYDIGLSSPSRLHDLFVKVEAMTPGEYKAGGGGITINYGFYPTTFGECLIATTKRGICFLAFANPASGDELLRELKATWPHASFLAAENETAPWIDKIFRKYPAMPDSMGLLLKGTSFQIKVWQALLKIPSGAVVSYEEIARMIDRPTAHRAVANAVAANPIAYLIPCHRVIQKMGPFGGYRWGRERKTAMLLSETVLSTQGE